MASQQTVKTLSARLDKLEESVAIGFKRIDEQIEEIAKEIDKAEFPESGDVGGGSIKQAFRALSDDVKDLKTKWDTSANVKEGIHETSKIAEHVVFRSVHEQRQAKVDLHNAQKVEIKKNLKNMQEEVVQTQLTLDNLGVEAEENISAERTELLSKLSDQSKEVDALLARKEELDGIKIPRHDRISRNCRICNKQCLYLCGLCSKDATTEDNCFFCCNKDCIEQHRENPEDWKGVKAPATKKSRSD